VEDAGPAGGDPLSIFLYILFLGFLLYLSGIFSGSETAMMSLGVLKLKELKERVKSKRIKNEIEDFVKNPDRFLTTILVMNNLVNILASSIATLLVTTIIPGSQGIILAIVTGAMTFLILVFGEITPKINARTNSEKVFLKVIGIISFMNFVLKPINFLLLKISKLIMYLLGNKDGEFSPMISQQEIISAFDMGHEEGILESEEHKMLKRTMEIKDISVDEVMTPRVEMICIDENDVLTNLLKIVTDEGYSRIPVFRENIDKIVGICYAKDILGLLLERNEDTKVLEKMKAKDIMRPPYFVPEAKKVDDLLKELRNQKSHIAIIIDEYGGTAGMVTMEDLIEELTGEIFDEYDEEEDEVNIKKIDDTSYILDGMTQINDIERELDIDFPETEFETIGGYLLELLERFPRTGEIIKDPPYTFEILASARNKIEKIKLTLEGEIENVDQGIGKNSDK